jgi:hypothetical protein
LGSLLLSSKEEMMEDVSGRNTMEAPHTKKRTAGWRQHGQNCGGDDTSIDLFFCGQHCTTFAN